MSGIVDDKPAMAKNIWEARFSTTSVEYHQSIVEAMPDNQSIIYPEGTLWSILIDE